MPLRDGAAQLGRDVASTHEERKARQSIPDEEGLRFAVANGRAFLSHHRNDFIRLHRSDPDHQGFIVCTDHPEFETLARKKHSATEALESLKGLLIRVSRGD